MTATDFLTSPLWSQLTAKHGWDTNTLGRMRGYRRALDSELSGVRAPFRREDILNRHTKKFLAAEGFTQDEVWRYRHATRLEKPALAPIPSIPERLSDFMTAFWFADTIEEVAHASY